MMLITTSPRAITNGGQPIPSVVDALKSLTSIATVGVISNQAKPAWFDAAFAGSTVQFAAWPGRAGGKELRWLMAENKIASHLSLVLAATRDDLGMAKNGGAFAVGAGWAADHAVAKTGLRVESPADFVELMRVVQGWSGKSWFRAEGERYSVEAVCDVSSLYSQQADAQVRFGRAVVAAVKNGAPGQNALLGITSCVLASSLSGVEDQMWGVYPSSAKHDDDSDTLSDFVHRLRTTVSNVRMARRNEPLFVRHRATIKRSRSGGDRTNPTSEVDSLHLNPKYRGKVAGRNLVVIDDCTTYGVSMGVAAGFLRCAGAASVTCLAVGKMGNRLDYYDVRINSDAFAPVSVGQWTHAVGQWISEPQEFSEAQSALRDLLG